MTQTIPIVRISYGWLLADQVSGDMNEKYGDGTPLRSFDEYEKIAAKYETWWRPHNEKILQGICDVLGLQFRQNIIDVYVVPWFWPISDPMVVGPAFEKEDKLVNTLTHEMIHRLLTDNTVYAYNFDFLSEWKSLFGDDHEFNTLVHIPVHAVMEALYRDVIDRTDLLEADIKGLEDHAEYANAWKYVQRIGYKKIVQQLKEARKEIK